MKFLVVLFSLCTANNLLAQNVGIGTNTPTEKLEVSGGIKIGNTVTNSAGTIRYNGDKFQAYENGWKALLASGTSYNFFGFTSTVRNSAVSTPWTITVPDDGQYLVILTSSMTNSQNYSTNPYDTHGYIYLKRTPDNLTVIQHHAAKVQQEITGTGSIYSLEEAEFPKIALISLIKNATLSISAQLLSGTPAPTSSWSIDALTIILVKLN